MRRILTPGTEWMPKSLCTDSRAALARYVGCYSDALCPLTPWLMTWLPACIETKGKDTQVSVPSVCWPTCLHNKFALAVRNSPGAPLKHCQALWP